MTFWQRVRALWQGDEEWQAGDTGATTPETGDPAMTTVAPPSEATLRAQRAARQAAAHLQESRDRSGEVDQRAERITSLTRANHFAEMLRDALRSGT